MKTENLTKEQDKANEGREERPAKKWLDKFGLHSRKNHGINAHLKPRLYFVKYEDAEQVIDTLTKQIANQMQDYHDKIAKLINEKAELRDQLRQRDELIKELLPIAEFAYTHFKAHKLNWATALETISRAKTILGI